MERVTGLSDSISDAPTVMTIGVFDGVHRGHQTLIRTVVTRAQAIGGQSAVMTFDPHPDAVLRPASGRLYLTSLTERAALISALGVDLLIVLPFTRELMAESAQRFMERVCAALPLRELIVGPDFALGRKREGTVARLQAIGADLGYTVQPFAPLTADDGIISSTRVRALLAEGLVEAVPALLGRPFALTAPVVHGDARGRTIGFPTANLAVADDHVIPANGVYVCQAHTAVGDYRAVTNVGVRPTFAGTQRRVEAHLLDFDGDLYGQELRVSFLARLRGEQKFSGIEALIAQIRHDADAARAWGAGVQP
jgi:riboflavin kinase / FMN adenylyltransferase